MPDRKTLDAGPEYSAPAIVTNGVLSTNNAVSRGQICARCGMPERVCEATSEGCERGERR